jgi:L-ascorbate metabolism protein UlaG (beta-lactamase superfamily)
MRIQWIRHATFLIEMNGAQLLVDPMLSPAGSALRRDLEVEGLSDRAYVPEDGAWVQL